MRGSTREAYRAECDPAKVKAEVARLHAEWRAHRKPSTGCEDLAAQSEAAMWSARWHERYRDQQVLLLEWARCTGQPAEMRRAIYDKEREAFAKSLIAKARAAQWEQEALQRAIRTGSGQRTSARSAA